MSLRAFSKKILKSDFAIGLISGAIAAYIRLVWRTTRWTIDGRDHFDALDAHGGGFILAFWHQRLLMLPRLRDESDRAFYMLISTHTDGDIIARAVEGFGVRFVRGSASNPKKAFKSKSGAPALAQLIAALEKGDVVGMTPDGPRGPSRKVQAGIVRLSHMTGAPILPISYATSRGRRLKSWDRFWLATPFSRGAFVAGAPISPPANTDPSAIDGAKAALAAALDEATARAEALAGARQLSSRHNGPA